MGGLAALLAALSMILFVLLGLAKELKFKRLSYVSTLVLFQNWNTEVEITGLSTNCQFSAERLQHNVLKATRSIAVS